jgi:hypothetical protein
VSLLWQEGGAFGDRIGAGFFSDVLLPTALFGSGSPNIASLPVRNIGMNAVGVPVAPTSTTITLNYSAGVFPNIWLNAGPMMSQAVSLTAAHPLTDRWSVTGAVNWARNTATSSTTDLAFTTYEGTASINYLLDTTWKASFVGTYGRYDSSGQGAETDFDVKRSVVMFMLTKVFDRELMTPTILRRTTDSDTPEKGKGGAEKK